MPLPFYAALALLLVLSVIMDQTIRLTTATADETRMRA